MSKRWLVHIGPDCPIWQRGPISIDAAASSPYELVPGVYWNDQERRPNFDPTKYVSEGCAESLVRKDPESWQIVTQTEIDELERMLN